MATAFDSTLSSLGIPTTASAAAQQAASKVSSSAASSQTLNQSDFLTLMTAQMKNQDPFNPVDDTQMVAQMAQFSSVAGISQMNTTLSSIASKLTGTSTSDAMSYVGKSVLTAGNTAYPLTSGGLQGGVQLAGDATDVKVTIADQSGNVLKTLDLGAQSQGTASYSWDGTTNSGAAAGSGPYSVSVQAVNGAQRVQATNLVWAPVESVSMPSGGDPVLSVTGVGQVDLSAVQAVG